MEQPQGSDDCFNLRDRGGGTDCSGSSEEACFISSALPPALPSALRSAGICGRSCS
ncbi:hypothetical protein PSMK_21360 [Phycisphaera mikurensis NBRC 102666]|uniref:Uncharacterized protein n=1 Tax=Phycisphaera mikurensis (strain NBRC 102666 / KCTC 22515 / FYK2301M01) TaxID=1142394 RepID=I0IGA7_PHYMF|nr:hypothetical protein PSMK_21360 [Phycisphaera mikurensis NBRC 102666]